MHLENHPRSFFDYGRVYASSAVLQGCDTEISEELLEAHIIVTNRAAIRAMEKER